MEISIQKGDAFMSVSENHAAGEDLSQSKPVVVAVGGSRLQLNKEEALDLAEVMCAYKDVAWRVG